MGVEFQSPWIRFARQCVNMTHWSEQPLFQSPWIRFARTGFVYSPTDWNVSIPVDKVRAEELFSAPPSDPNAVSIPVDKVRAKRIDFSDDGVTLGFNPRG